MDTLEQFDQLIGELHELALAETRFLQQHQRAPDEPLRQRKAELLGRLDQALAALRRLPAAAGRPALGEKLRTKVLQVLARERENEQLLLRCSLAGRPAAPSASVALLQSIYGPAAR